MLMVLIILIVLFARGHWVTVFSGVGLDWTQQTDRELYVGDDVFMMCLASVPHSNKDPQQRRQSKVSGKLSFLVFLEFLNFSS